MATQSLTASLWAVGIHGTTGQQTEEGTLAAGTLVREIRAVEEWTGTAYEFLASTDGGKCWFRQRSYERPQVA